ncbi:HlyD family efflux transporter periplasmic adaptor subunit [Rubripirellula amarantea]|nr:HlyD family efflux transporter periplasmic adaptor subunit [Rubripirellula amarantea]
MKFTFTLLILLAATSTSTSLAESFEAFTEPVQTIELSASESGRVADVFVKRGDRVRADSVILRLDSIVLEASRLIAVQEAESTTQIESLAIERDIKQNRREQVLELLLKGAVSPEEAKRATADADIAALNHDAAIEKQKLAMLKVKQIDGQLEQRLVRGQVNGLVIDVLCEAGEYVSTSHPHVATVVVLDQLRCTFFVSTEVADLYEAGETVDVMMERTNGAGERRLRGKVEYVAAVTQADSGRVRMDVLIENPQHKIRSGLRCRFDSPRTQLSHVPSYQGGSTRR